jgi:hypothetical protein
MGVILDVAIDFVFWIICLIVMYFIISIYSIVARWWGCIWISTDGNQFATFLNICFTIIFHFPIQKEKLIVDS